MVNAMFAEILLIPQNLHILNTETRNKISVKTLLPNTVYIKTSKHHLDKYCGKKSNACLDINKNIPSTLSTFWSFCFFFFICVPSNLHVYEKPAAKKSRLQ